MFAPPGAPDVLTLAQTAYNIYETYHGAQDRYKELCDDVHGLEITLKTLGNRLQMNHPATDGASGEGGYNEAKLEEILHLATSLLEDLQRKIPSDHLPRGLYRLKWSQNEVNAIRSRITGVSATIAAFNSSLVLDSVDLSASSLGETQQRILRTLEDVLISLQKEPGRRSFDEETSTLVEEETISGTEKEVEVSRSDLWTDLVTEMQKHGISETQIEQHKSMILQWAGRAIAAGILNQPTYTEQDDEIETQTYWEVISAVYGPRNVTSILQRMFDIHHQHRQHHRQGTKSVPKPLQFVITNEAFGGDPFLGHVKAFSMAWRKKVIRRHGRRTPSSLSYSPVQKVFAQEGGIVIVDFDQPLADFDDNDNQETSRCVQVIIASWHNIDVTHEISTLIQNGQTTIMATDMQLLTQNPSPGYLKVLSVTYFYTSYSANNGESQGEYQTISVQEGTELDIPPSLDILYANWGGLDITATLQSKIEPRTQTLTLDTNTVFNIASPDPWPGFHKAIVVIYRYNNIPSKTRNTSDSDCDGMELFVIGEGMGTKSITPYQSAMHRSQSWKLDLPFDAKTKILGVIWGLQPVSTTLMSTRQELKDSILQESRIVCTNKFLGGDGWFGRVKACLVLVQNVETMEINGLSGREGTILELLSPW